MSYGKSSLLRKLIPKSYHFDGYNEVNYPNTRDKPFFSENVTQIGQYYLTTRIDKSDNLILEYSSICLNGIISFKPYVLSFESFIELLRKSLSEDSDFITFEIQTSFKHTDDFCKCRNCSYRNIDCSSFLKTQPSSVMAAVSFEVSDIKNALSVYFGIKKTHSIEGGNNMNKNMKKLFGMNFELGMSKDRNIASTFMGVAVRNPENNDWYVFDSIKHTRTNISGMKMGDFPVFLLPTKTLAVGDLTKMDGKYYYVQSIDNNYITMLGAADGVIRQILPSESIIPGMNLFTKVVAFDTKTLIDPNSKENVSGNILAAMCMMQWSKGNDSEFSLDNIDDNSFNGLGQLLPVLMATGGANGLGNMFGTADGGINLPMLMMMGSGNDSDEANDMVQMLLISQMLGSNNPMSSMFDSITGITSTAATKPAVSDEVYCPNCGDTYSADVSFCPKCGTHTAIKGTVCSGCGATLKDGAAFCHVCGKKVLADTCPKCGVKITPEANFCPGCGTALKEEIKTTVPTPVVEQPKEESTVTNTATP